MRFSSSKRSNPIRVFEYKVFTDSLIASRYKDSMLTHGIIFPASALVASARERKMIFGTDSIQCTIHYATIDIHKTEEQSSVLLDIFLPPDKKAPDYDQYKTVITTYGRMVTGNVQHPMYKNEIKFYFEQLSGRKNFDSADVIGYLIIENDSFTVRPLYNEILLHGKNVKPMQILQGYTLLLADTAHGFLQHAPAVKSKDVLLISPKLSSANQLLVAPYFSLVSQTVYSTTNERIF